MKVFMTGTTGHAGGVALNHFVDEGHEVYALVRPQHIPNLARRERVHWVAGDFADAEIISEAAALTDAAVHIGASHDDEMERLDANAIAAIADAFDQSGKVFVSTSATPVYGDTGATPRDEHEPIENPHPLRAWRARHDLGVVGLSERGIRGVVVRPGLIYGRAGGWLAGLILRAQESGMSRYIGDGRNLTSTIHVDALADLYLKTVINESAHGIYNAASDEVVCSRDTAHLIATHYGPGIEAVSWPLEEAREALGELADLACVKCIVSSNRARSELDWHPIALSVTSELASGSYRTGPLIAYHL
jgi:nucleoside-diphosphate-sugar epimerase